VGAIARVSCSLDLARTGVRWSDSTSTEVIVLVMLFSVTVRNVILTDLGGVSLENDYSSGERA